jgi:hypothetical protein
MAGVISSANMQTSGSAAVINVVYIYFVMAPAAAVDAHPLAAPSELLLRVCRQAQGHSFSDL